jgi:hypothetical protein
MITDKSKCSNEGGGTMKKFTIRTVVIMAIAMIASLAMATAVAAGPFPTMP